MTNGGRSQHRHEVGVSSQTPQLDTGLLQTRSIRDLPSATEVGSWSSQRTARSPASRSTRLARPSPPAPAVQVLHPVHGDDHRPATGIAGPSPGKHLGHGVGGERHHPPPDPHRLQLAHRSPVGREQQIGAAGHQVADQFFRERMQPSSRAQPGFQVSDRQAGPAGHHHAQQGWTEYHRGPRTLRPCLRRPLRTVASGTPAGWPGRPPSA